MKFEFQELKKLFEKLSSERNYYYYIKIIKINYEYKAVNCFFFLHLNKYVLIKNRIIFYTILFIIINEKTLQSGPNLNLYISRFLIYIKTN